MARTQKIALSAPTLEKLLDYRDDDTEDGAFEVSEAFSVLAERTAPLR